MSKNGNIMSCISRMDTESELLKIPMQWTLVIVDLLIVDSLIIVDITKSFKIWIAIIFTKNKINKQDLEDMTKNFIQCKYKKCIFLVSLRNSLYSFKSTYATYSNSKNISKAKLICTFTISFTNFSTYLEKFCVEAMSSYLWSSSTSVLVLFLLNLG